ncbi:hypothetical protein PoB_003234700 [Plakobranchus ocellatus]|uniref:CUB domain-containing protein n=1 Tax=Plakobranchus ocellatus TaxID=259542 RepID=A0AAV4AF32_9GAST|nr:hypothetical protein PoB_003234700 [Plakobranchus ocellatus]
MVSTFIVTIGGGATWWIVTEGTRLFRCRAQPSAPWPDGGPESVQSTCGLWHFSLHNLGRMDRLTMMVVTTGQWPRWKVWGDCSHLRTFTALITVFIFFLKFDTVEGKCAVAVTELWAYSNPSSESFSDSYSSFLTSDKGALCQWLIISSHKEEVVELYFTDYNLKNTSSNKLGDCLYVYDGPSVEDTKLLGLCSGKPQRTYVSSGRELLVVYQRGKVEGKRSFSMVFVSKEVLSREKMIRIAGIVGGCIAVAVLAFILLRVTRCCRCLLEPKDGEESSRDIGGSALVTSARERDRLTQGEDGGDAAAVSVAGMRREARRVHGSAASVNRLGVATDNNSGVGATSSRVAVEVDAGEVNVSTPANSPLAPLATNDEEDVADLDPSRGHRAERGASSSSVSTGSSHGSRDEEVDELPPSYESLFLDENGGYPIEKPPDYSPPKHRSKHPPRRVHTFN